jgi:hypothetical protein
VCGANFMPDAESSRKARRGPDPYPDTSSSPYLDTSDR